MATCALLALPPEIIDDILGYISRIGHLVSFALTSHDAARHVIPRHTEYRFLQTTYPRFPPWHHLAQHTNLARNIRNVYIFDRNGNPFLDKFPKSLVEPVLPGYFDEKAYDAEAKYMHAILRSVASMDFLDTFVWSTKSPPRYPTADYRWEIAILDALTRKVSTITRLYLSGGFARYTPPFKDDPESIRYPGWRFTNLTCLSLHGPEWFTANNSLQLKHLLSRNPSLEQLEIPMEFSLLASCRFPHLKRLKLTLTSGAPIFIDTIHIRFLCQHEKIEDLYWYPIGNNMNILPPGLLPNLKRLSTDFSFAQALYANELSAAPTPDTSTDDPAHQPQPRQLECLDIRSLTPSLVSVLSQSPHSLTSLKTLILHSIQHNDPINQIPVLFPNISHLHLPSAAIGPASERMVFTVDGWLSLLPKFERLQVLRGSGIWETLRQVQTQAGGGQDDAGNNQANTKQVLETIIRSCPSLRELDDWKRDEELGEFMRIVVRRGEESGRITYHFRKPKPV
ncbi:hypothetical protein JOM56_007226 [Amanita muscaria]